MSGTSRYIVTCVNNIALIPKKESCDPSSLRIFIAIELQIS